MTNQLNDDQIRNNELDEIRNSGLKENNALRVHTYLRANERARSRRLPRWIWELLQNALDASTAHNDPLTVKIEYSPEELVFLHNGSSFKAKQIFNLIYHGSTKADQEEAIGEYGSGFLTTHLLSPEIKVSGQFNNKQWFDFRLTRKSDSPDALLDLMDEAWENFKESLSTPEQSIPDSFTTRFIYPIIGAEAEEAVEKGIETLKQCTPFVVVFNSKFSSIDINNHNETLRFEVIKRHSIDASGIQHITVAAHKNGNSSENKYILISDEKKTSVAAPLELNSDGSVCQSVEKIPRLFKAVPLVGTESFSFPAVINSLDFKPSEDRDDVYIGLSNDEANTKNQTVIEKSCKLLVHLLQYAASEGWHHVHQWAEVSTIQHPTEETQKWLRTCIREKFIEEIRKTPTVLSEVGNAIVPKEARLPVQENGGEVEVLWDLLKDVKGLLEKLPKREEAAGWCNTIKSWADVYTNEPMSLFSEAIDGRKSASRIEELLEKLGGYHIENLQKLLQENVCAVDWLNQFYKFLIDNGYSDEIRKHRFILDQAGGFHQLSDLHRDLNIANELKDIAKLLGWSIHSQLRNTKLISLEKIEVGTEDWDSTYTVERLLTLLRNSANRNPIPDDNFKKASVNFFAWIVYQKHYSHLQGFPVFGETTDSDEPLVIHLPRLTQDNLQEDERPLAPVLSWENDLQNYSELFPRRHILANTFFDAVPDSDIWQTLEEKGFIRKDVIIRHRRKVLFETFPPHDPLTEEDTHETQQEITVSNIAFLGTKDIGIIDRVRKSPPLARKFWHFLTEWLITHNSEAVKIIDEVCTCGETHRCYPAEWLVPMVNRKWVPLGESKADRVTAETLANLLRDSSWNMSSLSEDHPVAKLLEAISVARFDLLRQTAAENEDTRVAVDNALMKMIAKTGGNTDDLDLAIEYIEALKDDEDLPNVIAERRERKRVVRENQDLGQQVETLVKENLTQKNFEGKGFTLERTGKGSDFEMEDTEGITTLNVARGDRKWLIEVKATRTEGDNQSVRMTSTQAQTAVKENEKFLLCVVPLGQEKATVETVKENMRFIQNIGDRLTPLCENLDLLEDFREEITTNASSGVKLVCEAGTTRIQVNRSVWEDEGFPLEKLAEHLK